MAGSLGKAGRRAAASLSARSLSIRATGSERIAYGEREVDRLTERDEEANRRREAVSTQIHLASPAMSALFSPFRRTYSYLVRPAPFLVPPFSEARTLTPRLRLFSEPSTAINAVVPALECMD